MADRRALAGLASHARPTGQDSASNALAARSADLVRGPGGRARRAGRVLAGHRLVTAVGPGGVGKTRLALAVAADVADRYADGAWYVDLVPVTDPTMVGVAVATAFGFGEQPGRSPTDTLVAKLAGTESLLVLDNCEHLVTG